MFSVVGGKYKILILLEKFGCWVLAELLVGTKDNGYKYWGNLMYKGQAGHYLPPPHSHAVSGPIDRGSRHAFRV